MVERLRLWLIESGTGDTIESWRGMRPKLIDSDVTTMPLSALYSQPTHLLLSLLVIANLAFLGLQFSGPGPRSAESPVAESAPAEELSPSLQLVSELSSQLVSQRSAGSPLLCRAWGPYSDAGDLERVVEELGLQASDFEIIESEIPASTEYLVYIRPAGNRAAAKRVVEELRSQDIDSFIMGGRFSNSLSVGLFSKESGALEQQQRVVSLGYSANIEPLQRSERAYHLLARVAPERSAAVEQNRACAEIASVQQFL